MYNLGGCVLATNDDGVHRREQSTLQSYESPSDSFVGAARYVQYRLNNWNPGVDALEGLSPDRWVKSSVPPTTTAVLAAAR